MSDSDRSDASSAEPFRRRVEACQDALEAENADAVICFPGSNMTYLSGFAEEPMERHLLLFLTRKDAVFLVPELYAEQLAAESPVEDRRTWADGDDPRELIDSIAADLDIDGSGSRRILLDDRMWELSSRDVRRTLPGAEFGLASDILEAPRIRKDEGELERLREVARIADSASVAVRELGNEAVGTTETELARGIESRLTAAGGEALSFEPVVGSSPNGARPHHRHGDREIEAGEPVVLDFGTLIGGRPSDQTRTVVFDGEPSGRFERTHEGSGTHSGRALRRSDRTSRPGPSMRPLDR